MTCQCVGVRNVVWKVRGKNEGVWNETCQCVGVRNVVWKVRGKNERVTK